MKFLDPSQCRAARGLLNWSQPDLAERCGMRVQTISSFEQDMGSPTKRTLQTITETFEQHGIEFAEGGVKRNGHRIQVYQGVEGFAKFYDEIYEIAKTQGGEFCVNNVSEKFFDKWHASPGRL